MSNKITVSPDKDGRYIINLYGKDIEIDESMFVDGVATLKQFGDEYTIVKQSDKKAKKVKKEVEPATEKNSDTDTEADK